MRLDVCIGLFLFGDIFSLACFWLYEGARFVSHQSIHKWPEEDPRIVAGR